MQQNGARNAPPCRCARHLTLDEDQVMAKIPSEPVHTAQENYETLQQWYTLQQQLKDLRAQEAAMRRTLAARYFPNPREGTNRTPLGDGYDVTLQHGYTRKVDKDALPSVTAEVAETYGMTLAQFRDLFVYTPSLVMKNYNALDDAQRLFVDQFLDIKEKLPTLSIAPHKEEDAPVREVEVEVRTRAAAPAPAPKKATRKRAAAKKTPTKKAAAKKAPAKKTTRKRSKA